MNSEQQLSLIVTINSRQDRPAIHCPKEKQKKEKQAMHRHYRGIHKGVTHTLSSLYFVIGD